MINTDSRVAVLIPTHDHGAMIQHAIASAFDQTVPVAEVLVVGDGVPAETASLLEQLAAGEPRLRFFLFEKGPRHGEIHRHHVLSREASADVVCYLSDDDIWFPDHVETMLGVLQRAETAFASCVNVRPGGEIRGYVHNMSMSAWRHWVLENHNQVPLSGFAHRMATYEALPHGWQTTPSDIATDIYMYQQFFRAGVTAESTFVPTVMHFASRTRQELSRSDRLGELEYYAANRTDSRWRDMVINRSVLNHVQHRAARIQMQSWKMAATAIDRQTELESQIAQLQKDRRSGCLALRTLRDAILRRLRLGGRI